MHGAQDPEQQKEPTYEVTYPTYLAIAGGRLLYTPSVEHVVIVEQYAKRKFMSFSDYV